MASAGGANQAGAVILGVGSALQAKLPVTPEPENMNSTVPELLAVNLTARERADDAIVFVDEVEDFVW
jgi:hypothetical protein